MSQTSQNIEDLFAAYRAKVDGLTDALTKAKALVALDAWKSAEYAYQEQVAATASSYTTTGLTINKRSLESSRAARDAAVADLEGFLGTADAGVTFVDFGGCL